MDTLQPWFDVKEIPSSFLPYPKGTKIRYRPLLFGEVRAFSQSQMDFRTKAEFFLEGVETSFDKMDLTLPDFIFLMVSRKFSVFPGRKYYADVFCPVCGKSNKLLYSKEDVQFEELKGIPEFPIRVTVKKNISGKPPEDVELQFYPLTVGQYANLVEGDIDDETSMMAAQVKNIPFKEARDIIYNAQGEDVLTLEDVDRLLYHNMKPVIKNCEHENCFGLVKFDLWKEDAFLYPFRGSEESSGNRIRFGLGGDNPAS